jgi:hypothetical protein
MWERSAATPGVLTTSYKLNLSTSEEALRSSDKGFAGDQLISTERIDSMLITCPMPPEAPATTARVA